MVDNFPLSLQIFCVNFSLPTNVLTFTTAVTHRQCSRHNTENYHSFPQVKQLKVSLVRAWSTMLMVTLPYLTLQDTGF